MLKLAISYVGNGRRMPLLESLNSETIRVTARRIVEECLSAANHCEDSVLAVLLRSEARQAREILRAAGIDLEHQGVEAKR